jgi:uncharacterized membrane protein
MFTLNVSVIVPAPLEQVFAYVADFKNAPQWQHDLVDVRLEDGPFPTGKRVVEVRRFLGRNTDAPGRLVEWHPLQGFTVRGSSGPLDVESRYTFASESGGTRVSLALTMSARGPARLGEPLLRRMLSGQLAAAFERLKTCVPSVAGESDREAPAD